MLHVQNGLMAQASGGEVFFYTDKMTKMSY